MPQPVARFDGLFGMSEGLVRKLVEKITVFEEKYVIEFKATCCIEIAKNSPESSRQRIV